MASLNVRVGLRCRFASSLPSLINIRESAVLGLVGAGGIGVVLDASLNNLAWRQVGLALAIISSW